MKKIIPWLFVLLFICTSALAEEPDNLGMLRKRLQHYYESGEYSKQVTHVIHDAEAYLEKKVTSNQLRTDPEKLAIILDIDETSLSNFNHLQKLNFVCEYKQLFSHIEEGKDPAIAPTLNLYRYAKHHNVAVFFITGRYENLREITETNLKNVGYYHWDGLIMRPENDTKSSVVPFKSKARKEIEEQGYKIVINVGDQLSDLVGGQSEKTFKVPNPFYYIP